MAFILEDIADEDVPDMNNGMYTTGYLNAEGKAQVWATGLYNDKVNRTNIKSAYSAVFEAINNGPVKIKSPDSRPGFTRCCIFRYGLADPSQSALTAPSSNSSMLSLEPMTTIISPWLT